MKNIIFWGFSLIILFSTIQANIESYDPDRHRNFVVQLLKETVDDIVNGDSVIRNIDDYQIDILCENRNPVGCAIYKINSCFPCFSPTSEIIAIQAKDQKKDMRKKLLQNACRQIKKQSISHTTAMVFADDYESILLLEKAGFKERRQYPPNCETKYFVKVFKKAAR